MLQQTQVSTVIEYYKRFMKRFPTLKSLALADVDEVLALWSGLGYYARARNLYACANILYHDHYSRFPTTLEAVSELPGIGRSTAAAILSFSRNRPETILDGNVKRVLTRYYAIASPPYESATMKQLWAIAETLTDREQTASYNQAIMDLGATLCTRTKPNCTDCPMRSDCQAYNQHRPTDFPAKRKKKVRPTKERRFHIYLNSATVLLEKRPDKGIWGGLWSFPECDLQTSLPYQDIHLLNAISHQFTHYELIMHPVIIYDAPKISLDLPHTWYTLGTKQPGGLAAPVDLLLKKVSHYVRYNTLQEIK